MAQLRPIRRDDLIVGSTLAWDVVDGRGMKLLRKGSLISDEELVELLLRRECWAVEETVVAASSGWKGLADRFRDGMMHPFQTVTTLRRMLRMVLEAGTPANTFPQDIRDLARVLDRMVDKHPDASIASIFLLPSGDYAVRHQIDTAILSRMLMGVEERPEEHRISVVAAALTMNISMLEYQEVLQGQNRRLTEEERQELLRHPEVSESILRTAGVDDERWLLVVRQHHQRADGKGYPEVGLPESVLRESMILHLADSWTARMVSRSWAPRVAPNKAMIDMMQADIGDIPADLVRLLVRAVGIYPTGMHVVLASGEKGVVVRQGTTAHHPQVAAIWSGHGQRYGVPVVRPTSGGRHEIEQILEEPIPLAFTELMPLWEQR